MTWDQKKKKARDDDDDDAEQKCRVIEKERKRK